MPSKRSKRSPPGSSSTRKRNDGVGAGSTCAPKPNDSSPPFPKVPALVPVSPQNISTISSLAGSQELGRPVLEHPTTQVKPTSAPRKHTDSSSSSSPFASSGEAESSPEEIVCHGETQTLMQMLSLVGSTFLEADKEGFDQSDEAEDQVSSPIHQPLGKVLARRDWARINASDEADTPKAGGTPLSASVLLADTPKSPKASRKAVAASVTKWKDGNIEIADKERGIESDLAVQLASTSLVSTGSSEHPLDTEENMLSDHDRLTAQLKETFDLDADESLVLTQPCWLFRSLLLQGRIYLTTGHLCFYAYLPSREIKSIKSGLIGKKTRRTHRFSQHWASLKGGVLSWFQSRKDPYFPQGHIDLRKVSAIEPSNDHSDRFKVTTPARRYTFRVEDSKSRDSWISALRKETFRAQNEGESVRISLPLACVLAIQTSVTVDSTEMVSITTVDEEADFSADEYFFLHLANQDSFLQATKELLATLGNTTRRRSDVTSTKQMIRDTTGTVQVTTGSLATLNGVPVLPATHLPTDMSDHLSDEVDDASGSASNKEQSGSRAAQEVDDGRFDSSSPSTPDSYPPPPSSSCPPKSFEQNQKEIERGWAVPDWIKAAPSKVLGRGAAADTLASLVGVKDTRSKRRRRIVESWPKSASTDTAEDEVVAESEEDPMSQSGYSSFSLLDAPEESDFAVGGATFAEQLRQTFGLSDDELLLGHTHACLYRVLPIAGRFFVSTGHLAFRSSGIAAKTVGKTLMLAPMHDIVSASRHQALRPGQHGLVVTIRGHEELFIEISSSQKRDELLSLIENRIEQMRQDGTFKDADPDRERSTAFVLRDLSVKIDGGLESSSLVSLRDSVYGRQSLMLSPESPVPKPDGPLRFTLLTIGSRGDVQPYIALAKGLKADGHHVKIATHAEFGAWIISHGVEFSEIGGDPAELMRICVENGTFTVAFLREGMSKFRGWLDDLLASAWRACQGCDVIIECPSAIAGIHVAEALQVPYYRAFTMPWTRTRAYPHAFAVPKTKAGGNYNYMSYVIFDQMFWRASASQINRWRKNTLSLQPTDLDKLEQHKVPFIYNFSPSLVPRPLDWFEWIRVTGFWFLDNPENSTGSKWEPPVELTQFIQRARKNKRKLVYIGWGSIVVSDAEAVTRCVLHAVQKSGVCAILSKGWSDRLTAGAARKVMYSAVDPAVMEDVYQVTSVPHDWLFPQIDAACHHGGAGTLGASLRAGLPTVVNPFFGDQMFWGQQVESLGVGSCIRKLTVDNLATALVKATTDKKQIDRAKKLGKQILAEDGIGNALQAIYRDLDYARSRIKRNTRLAADPIGSVASGSEHLDEDGHALDEWTDVAIRT